LSVLGVIAGVVAGGIVVGLIEVPGALIHPLPPGVTMNDTAAMQTHFAKAPATVLLLVALAWTIGPLVASFVATAIARWAWLVHGLVIAAIFVLLNLANVVSFPHPLWLTLVGVVAPWASGWIGSTLAQRMFSRPTGPLPYDMRRKNMAC
jgi:hypothetical protein